MGFNWIKTPRNLKKQNLWKKTANRRQNPSGTVPRAFRREKEPTPTQASPRARARGRCTSTNQVNPVSDSRVRSDFCPCFGAPHGMGRSPGGWKRLQRFAASSSVRIHQETGSEAFLGKHKREMGFLQEFAFVACVNVGVGCGTVEMAARWFLCDRQEIPYKQAFLNTRFESYDWVQSASICVYINLSSWLSS